MLATLTNRLLRKLSRKEYRDAYVAENVRTGIAYQIRALREQRGWTQEDLGERIGAGQSGVARLEDPDYGRLNVSSLLKVAAACDVGLIVKFASFQEMILRSRDVSPEALEVPSWDPAGFTTKPSPAFKPMESPTSGSSAPVTTLGGKPSTQNVGTEVHTFTYAAA